MMKMSTKPETDVRITTQLPADFVPGEDDVLMGRGRGCYNHTGNVRFRNMCYDRVAEYIESRGKADKSKIIVDIVRQVREKSPHGGFVKRDSETGNWFEVRSNSSKAIFTPFSFAIVAPKTKPYQTKPNQTNHCFCIY